MPSASTWDSWNDALQDFLIHLKGTRAPKTVRFYAVQLRQLAHWAEENSIPLTGFGKRHLDRYLAFRAESVAPGTLRHDAVATKSFCRWCARNEILDRNPLSDYQIRAAPQPARFLPSDDQMSQLFVGLDTFWDPTKNPDVRFNSPFKRQFHRVRNYAIILGLVDTACRIGEMLSLKVEDVRIDQREVTITKSKGRRSRTLPFSQRWAKALAEWLKVRERMMAEAPEDEGWLFVSEFGGKIDEGKFGKTLKRVCRFVEVSEHLSPHAIRRYTLNRMAHENLLGTQLYAGHANPQTTLVYTRLDAGHLRDLHNTVNVVDSLLVSKRPVRKKLL